MIKSEMARAADSGDGKYVIPQKLLQLMREGTFIVDGVASVYHRRAHGRVGPPVYA